MRLLGALLLMLASCSWGFRAGEKVKRRSDTLRECVGLMQWFSSAISYGDEPVLNIIKTAVLSGEFKRLTFLYQIENSESGHGLNYIWSKAVDEQKSLDKNISALLKSFGAKLGKTDTNAQLELCAYYTREFERLLESALQKQNEQIKLYRIAGTSIGALLFVIFV